MKKITFKDLIQSGLIKEKTEISLVELKDLLSNDLIKLVKKKKQIRFNYN